MKQTELFETEKAGGSLLLCADAGADFSECGKYRYRLWRIWDKSRPLAMCIGLNPSTANGVKNDQTISYLIKMLGILGYGGFYMMNCYPLISSKPDVLREFEEDAYHDKEDIENTRFLMETAHEVKDVIFAWGMFPIIKKDGRDKMFSGYWPNALCFGINKDGSPFHPLAMMPRNGRDPNNPKLQKYVSGICA